LQKKFAGNRQLSKHIWFRKGSQKTIAHRSACYFFMLAPKEAVGFRVHGSPHIDKHIMQTSEK
jgi:hypothetical protein